LIGIIKDSNSTQNMVYLT